MTLDKAIEILELRIKSRPLLGPHEVYGAIALGIEALRRCKERSERLSPLPHLRFPGETPRDLLASELASPEP